MIRRYCDNCSEEMTGQQAGRLTRQLHQPGKIIDVEVTVGWNGTWNAGDLCHACIIKAVTEGKPSTKSAPAQRETPTFTIINTVTPPADQQALRERVRALPHGLGLA